MARTNHPDVDTRDWDYVPDSQELQDDWNDKHGVYQDEEYDDDEIDEALAEQDE